MDKLTFISKVLESIIWPLTIVSMILIFKKPIIKALSYIKVFRFKDIELEFDENIKNLEKEAISSLSIKNDYANLLDEQIFEKVQNLIEISPRLAIIESWNTFEIAAIKALQNKSKALLNAYSIESLLHLLFRNGLLNSKQTNIIFQLAQFRDDIHFKNKKISVTSANSTTHILLNYAEFLNGINNERTNS
jgi:hypothetical protein